jgi:hypothetical protein
MAAGLHCDRGSSWLGVSTNKHISGTSTKMETLILLGEKARLGKKGNTMHKMSAQASTAAP